MTRTIRIDSDTVREDFESPAALRHYGRAAETLGLWESERRLFALHFAGCVRLLELGCGAGRCTLPLRGIGIRSVTAVDFSLALLTAARELAEARGVDGIIWIHARAQDLLLEPASCDGVLFSFNGLMQIPGRGERRRALAAAAHACRPGSPFLFTTHDRDLEPGAWWRQEARRWADGCQDPVLVEFGDRRFEDESGAVFMHLPDRTEVLEDLAASGWDHAWDEPRSRVAQEPAEVRHFSDECRFWLAYRREPGS